MVRGQGSGLGSGVMVRVGVRGQRGCQGWFQVSEGNVLCP